MTRGVLNDLIGRRFGRLLVTARAPSDNAGNAQWSCSCDCGNNVEVRGVFLRKGQRSCGHQCSLYRQEIADDISGKRFGRLVAVERVGIDNRKSVWRFACDCGATKTMFADYAVSSGVKSCGCLGIESRIRHGRSHTRDYHREAHRKWAKANPARVIENASKRRRGFVERVPKWLSKGHKAQINDFYREAARQTELTGIEHHVDHIMPLRGRTSSGLHVPWNLQVIPAKVNLTKSNRVI